MQEESTEVEIAWVAGLLEGEGCFFLTKGNVLVIQLKMVDKDVVNKAALIMISNNFRLREYHDGNPNHNKTYTMRISGYNAYKWMKILRPYMGLRRSAKIDELIAQKLNGVLNFGEDFCKRGHSIKYSWEYYLNASSGGRQCRRCLKQRVTPPTNFSNLKLVNPFEKVS